jgi:hypothetical protein
MGGIVLRSWSNSAKRDGSQGKGRAWDKSVDGTVQRAPRRGRGVGMGDKAGDVIWAVAGDGGKARTGAGAEGLLLLLQHRKGDTSNPSKGTEHT